ncbi:universal stress protein [Antrihabitans sp. YC2-6]|uniref:universal stress protein n=1 Tax=Antrihabitans sp. YC2-6 TaxID=2799498 RepID=UPI0018F5AD0F|nr:universal stress protein [Antrihabitans sp. YC2-6]
MDEDFAEHPIVAAVDGSWSAAQAALWAADLATRLHCTLEIVHALPNPGYYFGEAAVAGPAELAESGRQPANRIVTETAELVREHFPDIDVSGSVSTGPAAQALIERSKNARMCVLGPNGTEMFGTILLGSTAILVVNNAHCPVVICRQNVEMFDSVHRQIIVGVDGTPLSDDAVEHAFQLAAAFGLPLVAVHAWQADKIEVHYPIAEARKSLATEESEAAALLAECTAGWSDKYPDVVVTRISERGGAAQILLNRASSNDIVVVGSRGRNRLIGPLLGSTSQNLIYHAPCPVVVCRRAG